MPFHPPSLPRSDAGTAGGAASSGVNSGVNADPRFNRVFDPYQHRREFPNLWAKWCRDNFRTSARLAQAFSVDDKTARDWMHGQRTPGGWAVDAAKDGRIDGVVPFKSKEVA